MKKTVFLLLAVTALALAGCAPSNGFQRKATFHQHPMINTNHPASPGLESDRGILLPLSPRSVVKIDVVGILAYVQGDGDVEATLISEAPALTPWLRFDFTF